MLFSLLASTKLSNDASQLIDILACYVYSYYSISRILFFDIFFKVRAKATDKIKHYLFVLSAENYLLIFV